MICGREVVGLTVLSIWKLNPISSILTFLTDPILVDAVVRIAPVPIPDVTVDNQGKE